MNVYQLLPTLSYGDAVGNDAIALDILFKQMGYNTMIYAENIDSRLPIEVAQPFKKMPRLKKRDILIYHMAIGTELNHRIMGYPCHKIMVYHNITPPTYFAPYSKISEDLCYQGLQDMVSLKDTFDYVLADSSFNRQNLMDAGYTCDIDVCPILIPFDDYKKKPDEKIMQRYSDGWTNILFVGRIAPNKKHEDIIKAFSCYKKNVNSKSRLILVGSDSGMESYRGKLEKYIQTLGVEDVVFSGHVKFEEILAYYHIANVFLCMSEHEGFCVPLVEAMYFDIPIIAYKSCAIPDTLGESGIMLDEKSPELTAAVIDRIVTDQKLQKMIIQKQRDRLKDFSYERLSELFIKQFTDYVDRNILKK